MQPPPDEASVLGHGPRETRRPLRQGAERGLPGLGGGQAGGEAPRDRHQEAPASAGAHERGAPEEPTARAWGRSPTLRGPPKLRLPRPGAPSR